MVRTLLNKITKSNSVVISYELLNDQGKLQKKRQNINVMSEDATDEDFFEVGSAAGSMLAYAVKEIYKSNLTLLMEG